MKICMIYYKDLIEQMKEQKARLEAQIEKEESKQKKKYDSSRFYFMS